MCGELNSLSVTCMYAELSAQAVLYDIVIKMTHCRADKMCQ